MTAVLEPAAVSILLVDDHAVVREGYRKLLQSEPRIRVVGEADCARIALELLPALDPDILIMDITLPDMSGIEVTRRALAMKPSLRVIVFSMHEDVIFATRSMAAGAAGYVTKSSDPTELLRAVREVSGGKPYLSRDLAQEVALSGHVSPDVSGPDLSEREIAILRLLAQGFSVKDVAHMLDLSVKTVANQQSLLRQKLGASTSIKLLQVARELGIVPSV